MERHSDTPEFDTWLKANDPDRERTAQLIARLDTVLERTDLPDRRECVKLARHSDMLMQAQKENAERDRLRCEAIRAQGYIAGKRDERAKIIHLGRFLLVYLAALCLFAAGLWWMVAR